LRAWKFFEIGNDPTSTIFSPNENWVDVLLDCPVRFLDIFKNFNEHLEGEKKLGNM